MIDTTVRKKVRTTNQTDSNDFRPRIACDKANRIAAFRLTYENYLGKGLIQPNPHRLRVTQHHLLPTTTVFNSVRAGQVIGTVSLIGDGELGLPMECIYSAEIEAAREQGLHIAEGSSLAVANADFKTFLPMFVELLRLMTQFARAKGMDQLWIAVHPKHARFYQRFMGFQQVGELKEYPSVQNAPAVACCLDFAWIDRERPACYDGIFGVPVPESELNSVGMTDDEREEYRDVVDVKLLGAAVVIETA